MKIRANLGHSKVHRFNLVMIFKEFFHRKVYYVVIVHMLSHYI
jgi:hypothetical protein